MIGWLTNVFYGSEMKNLGKSCAYLILHHQLLTLSITE